MMMIRVTMIRMAMITLGTTTEVSSTSNKYKSRYLGHNSFLLVFVVSRPPKFLNTSAPLHGLHSHVIGSMQFDFVSPTTYAAAD